VQQTNGQYKQLSGVHFPAPDTGWAVGNQGVILHTSNGGANWTPQTSGTTQLLRSVWFTTTSSGIAVGGGGTIKRTTDGGQSWVSVASGTANTLFSVTFIDELNGCIVGDNGHILRTNNGGQSWSQQSGVSNNILLFVNFSSGNAGYAVGFNGTLITTTQITGDLEIAGERLRLYPNPSYGICYLKFPANFNEPVVLNIYNAHGASVQSEMLTPPFREPIDIAHLSSGIYFIQVTYGDAYLRENLVLY